MPIYEYRRPDGSTFEVMQRMSEDALTHDPETGVPVQRVLSPVAIHFKGKGFYNTDYGTRRRQREQAVSDGDGKASEKSSEKSESKSSESKSSDGKKPDAQAKAAA
jgi:putative FmdB family regulatory protein